MNITNLEAAKVISKATKKATEIDTKMNIAVVDSGAHLVAFSRMDAALLGAIDIALKKATTASLFQKNTEVLGEKSQPGMPLFGIEHSNNGLITFAGGIPIRNKHGIIIGAIGVSGSTVENDFMVAQAGITAL